jgi:4-amino-4-deoxy-L-arabinose transferase-like glycosyltransferase
MKNKILIIVASILISFTFAISYMNIFFNLANLSFASKVIFFFCIVLLFSGLVYWVNSKYLLAKYILFSKWKRFFILLSSIIFSIIVIISRRNGAYLSISNISYIIALSFVILFFESLLLQENHFLREDFPIALKSFYNQTSPKIILLIFITIFLMLNFYWFFVDRTPPWWDQSWYLHNSEFFYNSLKNHGFLSFITTYINSLSGIKAPLISLLPLPWYLLGFHNYLGEVLTLQSLVLFFFIVLYKLISKIINPWVAILAVVISWTMPLVYGLSRQFLVEFGLMFLVTLWVLLQINSNHFQNDKYNVSLGCVLGLGLLMKTTFPIYIFGPVIVGGVHFLRSVSDHERKTRAFVTNIFIILALGILIAGTWYFNNFSKVMGFGLAAGLGKLSKDYSMGNPFDINTLINFWKVVTNYGISTYYLLLVFLFIVIILLRKVFFNEGSNSNLPILWGSKEILILWFFIPFLIFSLGENKDYRYLVPSFPALGSIIAIIIFSVIHSEKNRIVMIPLITIFPLFLMFYTSLPLSFDQKISRGDFILVDSNLGGYTYRPNNDNWPLMDIISWIDKDSRTNFDKLTSTDPLVYMIVNHIYFNNEGFGYYSSLMNSKVHFRVLITRSEAQWQEQKDSLLTAQYIITKTGEQGPTFTTYMNTEIRRLLESGDLPFIEVMKFDLPDGSTSTIYRRK